MERVQRRSVEMQDCGGRGAFLGWHLLLQPFHSMAGIRMPAAIVLCWRQPQHLATAGAASYHHPPPPLGAPAHPCWRTLAGEPGTEVTGEGVAVHLQQVVLVALVHLPHLRQHMGGENFHSTPLATLLTPRINLTMPDTAEKTLPCPTLPGEPCQQLTGRGSFQRNCEEESTNAGTSQLLLPHTHRAPILTC